MDHERGAIYLFLGALRSPDVMGIEEAVANRLPLVTPNPVMAQPFAKEKGRPRSERPEESRT